MSELSGQGDVVLQWNFALNIAHQEILNLGPSMAQAEASAYLDPKIQWESTFSNLGLSAPN